MEVSSEASELSWHADSDLELPADAQEDPSESSSSSESGLSSSPNASQSLQISSAATEYPAQSQAPGNLAAHEDSILPYIAFYLEIQRVLTENDIPKGVVVVQGSRQSIFQRISQFLDAKEELQVQRARALRYLDRPKAFQHTSASPLPNFEAMKLKSTLTPEFAEDPGLLPTDDKVFEAGFNSRLLGRSARLSPDSPLNVERFKLKGTYEEFKNFHSPGERAERENEAWGELVACMCPMSYNESLTPTFYALANDFFAGKSVHEQRHYELEHTKNLMSGNVPEPKGYYTITYFQGDWAKVLQEQTLRYDMVLSKFLLDLVQNNKFEKAAQDGATLKTRDHLRDPYDPQITDVTDIGDPSNNALGISGLGDHGIGQMEANGVSSVLASDHTAENEAATEVAAPVSTGLGITFENGSATNAAAPFSATPDDPTEDGAAIDVTAPATNDQGSTAVDGAAAASTPLGKNNKRNAKRRTIKKGAKSSGKSNTENDSPNNSFVANTPVDSPTQVPTQAEKSIKATNLTDVVEPVKPEQHTNLTNEVTKQTEAEKSAQLYQLEFDDLYGVSDDDGGDWSVVQSKSSRKPGKLRGERAEGPAPGTNVSARGSSGLPNSTSQNRSRQNLPHNQASQQANKPQQNTQRGKPQANSKFSRNRKADPAPKPVALESASPKVVDKPIDFSLKEYPPLVPSPHKSLLAVKGESVEKKPVQKSPTKKQPANKGPIETAPVKQVHVEEAPAVNPPIEKAPPAEKPPAEKAPVEKAHSAEKAPAKKELVHKEPAQDKPVIESANEWTVQNDAPSEDGANNEPAGKKPTSKKSGYQKRLHTSRKSRNKKSGDQNSSNNEADAEVVDGEEAGGKESNNKQSSNKQSSNKESSNKQSSSKQSGSKESSSQQPGSQQSGSKESSSQQPGSQQSGDKEPDDKEPGDKKPDNKKSRNKKPRNRKFGNKKPGNKESGNMNTDNKETSKVKSTEGDSKSQIMTAADTVPSSEDDEDISAPLSSFAPTVDTSTIQDAIDDSTLPDKTPLNAQSAVADEDTEEDDEFKVVVWTSQAVIELLLHHPPEVTRDILMLRKSASETDLGPLVEEYEEEYGEPESEEDEPEDDKARKRRRRGNTLPANDAPQPLTYKVKPLVDATSDADSNDATSDADPNDVTSDADPNDATYDADQNDTAVDGISDAPQNDTTPLDATSDTHWDDTPVDVTSDAYRDDTPVDVTSDAPQDDTPLDAVSDAPQDDTPVDVVSDAHWDDTPVDATSDADQNDTTVNGTSVVDQNDSQPSGPTADNAHNPSTANYNSAAGQDPGAGQIGGAGTGGDLMGDPLTALPYQTSTSLPPQFGVCSHCMKVPTTALDFQIVCPGCGTDHYVRYCSHACLLADAYDHAGVCLRRPMPVRLFPTNVSQPVRQSLTSLAPPQNIVETSERFRQRMFSMYCSSGTFPPLLMAWGRKMNMSFDTTINGTEWFKKTGDYAIFRSDLTGQANRYNPKADVIFTVKLLANDPRKQYLVRVLNACFVDPHMDLLEFLFRLIQSLIKDPEYFETFRYFEPPAVVFQEFCAQFAREWHVSPNLWISDDPFDIDVQWLYALHTLRPAEAAHPVLGQAWPILYRS